MERFWGQGGVVGGERHGLQLILPHLQHQAGKWNPFSRAERFTGRSKVLDPIRERDHSDKSLSHNMHKPGQNLPGQTRVRATTPTRVD